VLISIITINYNDKLGLEQTIKSVQNQESSGYEHIIIDGNSTDGSKTIIEKYKFLFSYAISESDTGVYNAMNKGIRVAKGKYLLFLNSGDVLHSKHVIHQVKSYLDTNLDLYFGNIFKIYPDGNKVKDLGLKDNKITLSSMCFNTINHPSAFIKKNVFDHFGLYDENLKIVSDWKFFLIAFGLNNSSYKYLDIDITNFKMDGISTNNLEQLNLERQTVLNELIPEPIFADCLALKKAETELNSSLIKNTLKLKSTYLPKKIVALIVSVFVFLVEFKRK